MTFEHDDDHNDDRLNKRGDDPSGKHHRKQDDPSERGSERSMTPAPVPFDRQLTELAEAAGARRFGSMQPEHPVSRPLPDPAIVIAVTMMSIRQIGHLPLPVRTALNDLAERGDPTARVIRAWVGKRTSRRSTVERSAR
ncbi:hypothetical protein DYI37_00070 [Fulvimarina endophytica]|uniref:Uncharacterized protein n=1 Tax=Fulvimarina endophytica TaxID=2293836 RepID=A0A371X9Q0_9HYPH|nr:hypothetical protein [Fulvimarina endophytica]RFC65931.1 hypothetical protein DYI37_00070 [Fulvimarina endophytica]